MIANKSTELSQKIKTGIFAGFSLCIEKAHITSVFYFILILIETFITMMPAVLAIDAWNPKMQYFRDFLRFTNSNNSRQIEIVFLIITLIICFIGFWVVLILPIISSNYHKSGGKMIKGLKWLIPRSFEYFIFVEKCAFYIPFMFCGIFLEGLPKYDTEKEDETWDPTYESLDYSSYEGILFVSLIIVCLISFIVAGILFSIFSIDPQANSDKCWNSESSVTMALKYLLKVYQGLLLGLDSYAAQNKLLFVFPPAILLAIILLIKYWHPPQHQYFFSFLSIGAQIITLFAYLFAIYTWMGGIKDYKQFLAFFIIYISFTALYLLMLDARNHSLLDDNMKAFRSPTQVLSDSYIYRPDRVFFYYQGSLSV